MISWWELVGNGEVLTLHTREIPHSNLRGERTLQGHHENTVMPKIKFRKANFCSQPLFSCSCETDQSFLADWRIVSNVDSDLEMKCPSVMDMKMFVLCPCEFSLFAR